MAAAPAMLRLSAAQHVRQAAESTKASAEPAANQPGTLRGARARAWRSINVVSHTAASDRSSRSSCEPATRMYWGTKAVTVAAAGRQARGLAVNERGGHRGVVTREWRHRRVGSWATDGDEMQKAQQADHHCTNPERDGLNRWVFSGTQRLVPTMHKTFRSPNIREGVEESV